MQAGRPLLSLCIPTYNRMGLLSLCLDAVLDQASEERGLVELVIADNASSDATWAMLERRTHNAPTDLVRIIRRKENIGPIRNVVHVATHDAQGEFVLVIGDDDLFAPGAVKNIVAALHRFPAYDLFYSNLCTETGNDGWPDTALGGFAADPRKALSPDRTDREVDQWIQLLNARNELGTHLYCHVVRRSLWRSYWSNRNPETPYTSLHSTYPHTAMLLHAASHKPAVYLRTPHLTAFYATTSWGSHKSRIFLSVLPELLAVAIDRGLPSAKHETCRRWLELIMASQVCDAATRTYAAGLTAAMIACRSAARHPSVRRSCLRAVGRGYARCLKKRFRR